MRAVVWNEKGSLELVDKPAPEPRPGRCPERRLLGLSKPLEDPLQH